MFRNYKETIRTRVNTSTTTVNQTYECDFCNKREWVSETDLALHRKAEHYSNILGQYRKHLSRFCGNCMKLQNSSKDLLVHVKSHHLYSSPKARRVEREIFVCEHCHNVFFNKIMLETHILHYHSYHRTDSKREKKINCPKCYKLCRIKSIWFHLTNCHDIPSMTMCDICITNTQSSEKLAQHLKEHQTYLVCETCHTVMSKESSYEAHVDKHTNTVVDDTQQVNEELLSSVFVANNGRVKKILNIHDTLKGLQLPRNIMICSLCREICYGKDEARLHYLRCHTSPPRVAPPLWTCSCGAAFVHRVLLKQHVFKNRGDHTPVSEKSLNEYEFRVFKEKIGSKTIEYSTTSNDEQIDVYTRIEVEIENQEETGDRETSDVIIGM